MQLFEWYKKRMSVRKMLRVGIKLKYALKIFVLLIFSIGCVPRPPSEEPDLKFQGYRPSSEDIELLENEIKGSFRFFYETANKDKNSPGYGLIPDRMPGNPEISSIASVGYGLAALCIGDKRGFETRGNLEERVIGTLETLRDLPGQKNGFYYHFLDMQTGERAWNCELSVIDTAILVQGVLMAGEYFGGKSEELAKAIYERVQWNWYTNPQTGRFYMGYTPEGGFFGSWDMTAEQKMMYFLGAGSPSFPIDPEMFYRFARPVASYSGLPGMIRSPAGSLFVYQFSHAWYDFRMLEDRNGTDWFYNSVVASLSNRRHGINQAEKLKTGPDDWGFTACDGPDGYNGSYGAPPRANTGKEDGTVPPCGPAGSMVFTPEYSVNALRNMIESVPGITGEWGFKDAYNRNHNPVWVARDVIGIDKGITILMLENYLTGFVWEINSRIEYLNTGMEKSGLVKKDDYDKPQFYIAIPDGGRAPGDKIQAVWHYWDINNRDSYVTDISWYRSKQLDGPWEKIENASGREYVIQNEDSKHFISFSLEGVYIEDGRYITLDKVQSRPFGTIFR